MSATTDSGLPARRGPRPAATPTNPHVQLDQNAPLELQERLFERAHTLPGVHVQPSMISVPGARAFVLSEEAARGPTEAFMIGREFAHLHPASDGSLHAMLPPDLARTAEEQGWGEQHPVARMGLIPPTAMMVYGPRDDDELEVVWTLLRASHAFATGASQPAGPAGQSVHLDGANFRRSVLAEDGWVIPTGRRAQPGSAGGKPAELYRAGRMWKHGGPIRFPQPTAKRRGNQHQ